MADELTPDPADRYAFLADDKMLAEEELPATRPDGYEVTRPRSIPYRYENWGDLSALLAVSQELTASIGQLRLPVMPHPATVRRTADGAVGATRGTSGASGNDRRMINL